MADIVIINPKFEMSFFGLEGVMPFVGKRTNMPVGALALLGALTPPEHQITLIDENVEEIDYDRCARADIVGVTGMIVQRQRMMEVVTELKQRGCYVVIGGPWVTVKEDYFGNLADAIFVGEAEETWPQFLKDWQNGNVAHRYEQAEATDMTRVPAPRYDLLKMNRYFSASVQFTRGCPFTCEFCDIIVIFGRKPRLKTPGQIIAELDALRDAKVPFAFIVDDNLIGNKKEMKKLLRHVIDWQWANSYPLTFVTEASLDLADDDELMRLMVEANINGLFVGIESTNEESLRETKKLQNIRRTGTLLEKVHRIQDAGIEVWAGMMVGFDNDKEDVFDIHRRFLEQSRISIVTVSMLTAIPKTPLYDRLAKEGRLDSADNPSYGSNVLPLQMSRETMSRGYVRLVNDIYDPEYFFKRVDELWVTGPVSTEPGWRAFAASHPWQRLRRAARNWGDVFALSMSILAQLPDRKLRRIYIRRFLAALCRRPDAGLMRVYALRCALHFHFRRFADRLQAQDRPIPNTY